MGAVGPEGLVEARAALDRSDWSSALCAFERADAEASLRLEDLERAASAAMWVGDTESSIEFRQRAFALCSESGDMRRSAGLAIDLCFDHARCERMTVATSWMQRAEQLLEGCEPCSELGRLHDLRGIVSLHMLRDLDAATACYEQALHIGRICNDVDLIACASMGRGTVLVRRGKVAEGMRLVDDAMIDAVSGRLGNFMAARVYCGTISLCQALGDIRRASEWTEQVAVCSRRPGMGDFPGDCRMHRAEVTRLQGDWAHAESELHQVMAELQKWDPPDHVGQAWYELGEIALRRGDLASATDAFERAAGCGKDPQPGLAMLRLAQGEQLVASALLRAAVVSAGDADPLAVGQLLPAAVEVQLACGDLKGAAEAATRLEEIAGLYNTVLFVARAAKSKAQVALAGDAPAEAVSWARTAVNLWRDAGAPYEAAQTQVLLARGAVAAGDVPVAVVELDAALTTFSNLGARRDLELTRELRDRLGHPEAGQRVCRTFMFTDIVDSTRLVAAMGDERWATVLRWHDTTIRDRLARHAGIEVKQRGGGDGFFAVFMSPSDAIACGVDIQRTLAGQRATTGFAPDVRIGLHQADALLRGSDFAGLGIHEAARIAALADGDTILASASTVRAVPATQAGPTRHVALKGIDDEVAVREIYWNT